MSNLFHFPFFVGGVSLNPLFDNGEFQSSHVQRVFQYLKFWESARDNLNKFWFTPSQVMGDHAECIETLVRYTLYKNICSSFIQEWQSNKGRNWLLGLRAFIQDVIYLSNIKSGTM